MHIKIGNTIYVFNFKSVLSPLIIKLKHTPNTCLCGCNVILTSSSNCRRRIIILYNRCATKQESIIIMYTQADTDGNVNFINCRKLYNKLCQCLQTSFKIYVGKHMQVNIYCNIVVLCSIYGCVLFLLFICKSFFFSKVMVKFFRTIND